MKPTTPGCRLLRLVQVKDNYCQDSDMPFAWVHPLKETAALLEVARTSEECTWSRPWENADDVGSI